jgi:hypothetical protein
LIIKQQYRLVVEKVGESIKKPSIIEEDTGLKDQTQSQQLPTPDERVPLRITL